MAEKQFHIQQLDRLVVWALLALNLINWLSFAEGEYGIPAVVKYVFTAFVLAVLVYDLASNPNHELRRRAFTAVIWFFVLWSLFLLATSALRFTGFYDVQMALGKRYFYLPYLLPLLILFTAYDEDFFGYYLRITYRLLFVAILLEALVFVQGAGLENFVQQDSMIRLFNLGGGFLLLTSHMIRRKEVGLVAWLFIFIYLVLCAMWGKRGIMVDNLLLVGFVLLIRLRSSLGTEGSRGLIYISTFFIGFALVLAVTYLGSSLLVFERGFTMESFEASRGDVFRDFFSDFRYRSEWIFGRGLDGVVMRSIEEEGSLDLVESGILTIILRGGLLYLLTYLALMLWSAFLGFFRSENDLSKALAAVILVQVFSMLSFGLPEFSTHYIFVWMAVSAGFSRRLRMIDNFEMSHLLNRYFS